MMRWPPLWAVVLALVAPASAAAQGPHSTPLAPTQSVLQGKNSDEPIQIDAATLEVHDKSKVATFSGDVQVVQGDTTMKCQTLVVFYGGEEGARKPVATAEPPRDPKTPGQSGPGMPQGAQDIRRIEARGGVTVITKDQSASGKDQSASGDLGVYDLKAKTITLTGNVVVTQGKNILRGDRVVVETTTGNARVESDTAAQSRVRALILPGKGANGSSTNVMSFGPSRTN